MRQFNGEMRQFNGEMRQFNDEMRQLTDDMRQLNGEMRQIDWPSGEKEDEYGGVRREIRGDQQAEASVWLRSFSIFTLLTHYINYTIH